ncbi:hypothetical protein OIU74_008659 [Salix koriyanagi]|uniref:Uncharacterized protein n=1 Tax=Salix koriyanagi TaxID=2511006 RepID=A0A9Q0YZR9_9ROSI|nr:hypothetical protein OIU74_008659 [Salix koriyanagi]
MGLLRFDGGIGEWLGDRRLRGKEGCLVHGGERDSEGEIDILLLHSYKMCTRLCNNLWLWRSDLMWRSSKGASLFGGGGGAKRRRRRETRNEQSLILLLLFVSVF